MSPTSAPESDTGTIDVPEHPRPGLFARLAASVSDPVLRILVGATLISRVGRGIFLTVTVLYFTFIVGLAPHEVAIVLAAASAAGVVASLAGGWLADRFSAKRLVIAFTAIEGVALISYVFAGDFISALVIAVICGTFESGANSTRSAIIARAFEGESRVHARAVLRTVTNLSIAVGSGLGALALAVGTAEAYRGLIVGAGVLYLLGLFQLVRLPARVDAPPRPEVAAVTTATGSVDAEATADAAAESRRDWGRRSPWRDPRYLVFTALSAVFGMQFGVAELGVPLWIAHETAAPEVLVALLLILNTVIVVIFQVPLSKGTHDFRVAARVSAISAWLMAGACLVYAAAAGLPVGFAIAVLVIAALAHAFAEVLSQAGGWGLSFELADPMRAGAYQGVFGMGYSVGALAAPIVVNATAIAHGFAGWATLAAIFLGSGLGTWWIARRAAATSSTAGSTAAA
ncbi:MFS transporter [Agromyces sp. SYSU K20354]|uniref:MFS transporter n=1 Tax=Agromyces cavernae TaxID=2898659 RepID=UPI001E65A1C6|nr:MFS transporter [Agromyces cavernae]MCD2443253.1 MFS transporter [Agromyces cavernae]